MLQVPTSRRGVSTPDQVWAAPRALRHPSLWISEAPAGLAVYVLCVWRSGGYLAPAETEGFRGQHAECDGVSAVRAVEAAAAHLEPPGLAVLGNIRLGDSF